MLIPTGKLEMGSVITLMYGCISNLGTSEFTRNEFNSILSTHQFLYQPFQHKSVANIQQLSTLYLNCLLKLPEYHS